jgi:hypothetical protein
MNIGIRRLLKSCNPIQNFSKFESYKVQSNTNSVTDYRALLHQPTKKL